MSKDLNFPTAIHALTLIAFLDGEIVTSSFISQSLQANDGLVRRLLSRLANAGLIVTKKGKNGGSLLQRSPSLISLEEIYNAVGPTKIFSLTNRKIYDPCPVSNNIPEALEKIFCQEEAALRARLEKIKLSDLLNEIPKD